MPVAELLLEGTKLMLLGMGTVFVFLMLLVVAMTGMSRLARFFDSKETVVESAVPKPVGSSASEEQELVAVMAAAIKQYRAAHP